MNKKTSNKIIIGIITVAIIGLCINSFTNYKIVKAIEMYQKTTTINFR